MIQQGHNISYNHPLSTPQLALANGATGIATQLLDLGAQAQLLPAAYTQDDDSGSDYDADIEYAQVRGSL